MRPGWASRRARRHTATRSGDAKSTWNTSCAPGATDTAIVSLRPPLVNCTACAPASSASSRGVTPRRCPSTDTCTPGTSLTIDSCPVAAAGDQTGMTVRSATTNTATPPAITAAPSSSDQDAQMKRYGDRDVRLCPRRNLATADSKGAGHRHRGCRRFAAAVARAVRQWRASTLRSPEAPLSPRRASRSKMSGVLLGRRDRDLQWGQHRPALLAAAVADSACAIELPR